MFPDQLQQKRGLLVPHHRQSPVERIRKRGDFLACYRQGKRYSSPNFLYYIRFRAPDGIGVRLGTTVTKKVGKAVVRTRIKRLIKEVFRLNRGALRGRDVDIVVVAKKNIDKDSMSYQRAERELMRTVPRVLGERSE